MTSFMKKLLLYRIICSIGPKRFYTIKRAKACTLNRAISGKKLRVRKILQMLFFFTSKEYFSIKNYEYDINKNFFEVKKRHVNDFSYSSFFSGNKKSAEALARLSHATLALFIVKSLCIGHPLYLGL